MVNNVSVFKLILTILLTVSLTVQAENTNVLSSHQYYKYKVKRDDQLGTLLYSLGYSPLWGKTAYVNRIIALNGAVINSDGNLLIPKDTLLLPSPIPFKSNYKIEGDYIIILEKVVSEEQYLRLLKENSITIVPAEPKNVEEIPLEILTTEDEIDVPINESKKLKKYKKKKKKPFKRGITAYKIMPTYGQTKITGEDTDYSIDTQLVSLLDLSIKLQMDYAWSSDLLLQTYYQLQYLEFQQGDFRTLESESVVNSYVGIASKYRLIKNLKLYSDLRIGQENYLVAIDGTNMKVDQAIAAKIKLGLVWNMFSAYGYYVGMNAGGQYLSGASLDEVNSKAGSGYYASLYIRKLLFGYRLKFIVDYDVINKDTDVFTQEHSNINYRLELNFKP